MSLDFVESEGECKVLIIKCMAAHKDVLLILLKRRGEILCR